MQVLDRSALSLGLALAVLVAPGMAEVAARKGPPPLPARKLIDQLRQNELGREALTQRLLPKVESLTLQELLALSELVDRKDSNLHTGSVLYRGMENVSERISVDTARHLMARFAQVYDYRWSFAERVLPKVERLALEDLARLAAVLDDRERFFERAVRYLDGELPFAEVYRVLAESERLGYGDASVVIVQLLPKLSGLDADGMQKLLALVQERKSRTNVALRCLDYLVGGLSFDQAKRLVTSFPEQDTQLSRFRVAHKAMAEVRGLDLEQVRGIAGLLKHPDPREALEGRGQRLLARSLAASR